MKPTVEIVKEVWEAHPEPSARAVAAQLHQEGFEISWRSVARWKKNNWLVDVKGSAKRSIAENQHTPAPVKREIRAELAKMPAATVAEANQIAAAGGLEAAVEGGKLTDPDYERIEKRKAELEVMTAAQLIELQEKARTIMNIVLMEEAVRKAHVMVLIPKDTGSFMADAAGAARASPAMAPILPPDAAETNGDGAKLVNGRTMPDNPVSSAIDRFLAEHA